ncbi:MAG: ATP-binding cassette domain-containing protein [Candidatus Peribacteraceae bacterium]|nr:ATP-binding cassette domain-containing protein [Candidatus Peribacteraceae bacterium]
MSDLIITAQKLTKKFGDFTAVNAISFAVPRGEIFAFLGPNGAGKTTTIKMLTTLLHPTSGQLTIAGFDPVKDQAGARRTFGIVFQDPSLDDELTAKENLELHGVLYGVPRDVREKRMTELLGYVDLADRTNDLVKHFSGGMKRRLEIARSLMHHPQVLFLDEPTVGLDPQTRNKLWEYIRTLNTEEGMTVFMTTHYMEEAAKIAGRIAIMDHGNIVALGTAEQLIAQTKTQNLEDAFLALTGNALRDQDATNADHMRSMQKMWRPTNRR